MLKQSKRLRSEEVAMVLAKGSSVRSEHLQIKLLDAPGALRSAAVVPKALARKAVQRNSLRRALYRAIAASGTSGLKGMAVFFVRTLPKEKMTPTFEKELPSLLSSLESKLKLK